MAVFVCRYRIFNLIMLVMLFWGGGDWIGEKNLAVAKEAKSPFSQLKIRLEKDGIRPPLIEKVYDDAAISFDVKGVSLFFVHSESRLNYDQFLKTKSIAKAQKYLVTQADALNRAREVYGVDETVITAILLVETRLGGYVGNRLVINTLSTMSVLSEPDQREQLWRELPHDRRMARDKFEKKADQKSSWAYKELKSFLQFCQREGIDPVTVKGSYAGAMGICQFMPSNALTLARDGNGDGKIDLFTHSDAIHSAANYLKRYGWQPSINRKEAFDVLYKYNHSKYYVNTLLKISDRLKK